MRLDVLRGEFAIVRLDASAGVPPWIASGCINAAAESAAFLSITRTRDELSIVCESSQVPVDITAEVHAERGYRCIKVDGPLDLSLVGVLASLAEPLARAGIPIFAISTFDTDYILVRNIQIEAAVAALERTGHVVREIY